MYYFLGKTINNEPELIEISADTKDKANLIINQDTVSKGYKSIFWDKWGIVLSVDELKSINRKIMKFTDKI